MNYRRWISILLAGSMLLGASISLIGCQKEETPDVPDTPVSDSDTTPEVPEVPAVPLPKLATLTLDDGTELNFDPENTTYNVALPAGRPRIPRVAAAAEDAEATVTVYQPMFPDDATEAIARVDVKLGELSNSYTIHFKKDAANGFHLQYDDRYTFTPDYTLQEGEAFTFESSNAEVASVDETGLIKIVTMSDDPVTITAKVNDEVKGTFTIDKTIRAQINIFLIVGQSNSAGTYDSGLPDAEGLKVRARPPKGTVYCVEGMGKPYDMNRGRAGYAGALGQRWYELTGEKSFVVQTAVGGSAIERWEEKGDLYGNTLSAYNRLITNYTKEDSKYEIIRTGYFWCQGETAQYWTWKNGSWDQTGSYIMTADDYYARFMKIHENFVKDMNAEFGSILLVRAIRQVASRASLKCQYLTDLVAPRVAQYTIHNTTDSSLIIASRIGEIARPTAATDTENPGHGYMGPANLHYSQKGYNAAGVDLAENTFSTLSATADRTPEKIDVLSSNGRDRLNEGDTITVDVKKGYQLAAIVMPLYATDAKLSFEVTENADKCSVDMYGKITFNEGAQLGDQAKVTIKNESGLSVTINAVLGEVEDEDIIKGKTVTYHWNFDDLKEVNEYSDLSLSDRSSKDAYSFKDGCIEITDDNTDFKLAQPFVLSSSHDWNIEWRGQVKDNSCLFGAEYSANNFIYLAYNVPSFGNSLRMVDDQGNAAQIPFRKYLSKVTEMSTWRLEYKTEKKTMTLYYKNMETGEFEKVGSFRWSKDFAFYITNMFGRFNSTSTLVCYMGTMDYIFVDALIEE
ncbi:MAG: hypothetical protein IJ281_04805 [Clostridia bacterium]|nr:hypothetical protein [Clostridia bacterium]